MTEIPDTGGNIPKAKEYVSATQVEMARDPSTQASSPQVRTVPTRIVKDRVSLRYAPLDRELQVNTSSGE